MFCETRYLLHISFIQVFACELCCKTRKNIGQSQIRPCVLPIAYLH